MTTTLKTKVTKKETPGGAGPGTTTLHFGPDYDDDRNKEWAAYTPALSIVFTVKDEALAASYEVGETYTFTIERS